MLRTNAFGLYDGCVAGLSSVVQTIHRKAKISPTRGISYPAVEAILLTGASWRSIALVITMTCVMLASVQSYINRLGVAPDAALFLPVRMMAFMKML